MGPGVASGVLIDVFAASIAGVGVLAALSMRGRGAGASALLLYAAPAFLLALLLPSGRLSSPMGLTVYMDLVSRSFLLYTCFLAVALLIYTRGGEAAGLASAALAASAAAVIYDDLLVAVAALEAVAYIGYLAARSGGRGVSMLYYASIHLCGLLLVAGAALAYGSGVHRFSSMEPSLYLYLVVAGLAAKLGLVPLHYWVQPLYRSSRPLYAGLFPSILDPAAAALLARLSPAIAAAPLLRTLLLSSAAATGVAAAIWYWGSRCLRDAMAWSTLYNMGVLAALASLPGLSPLVLAAYIVGHGAAKLGLFIVIERAGDTLGLREASGSAAVLLASSLLFIEGMPPSTFFYAKIAALTSIVGYAPLPVAVCLAAAWMASSIYFVRLVLAVMFPRETPRGGVSAPSLPVALLLIVSMASYPMVWVLSTING